MAAKLAGKVAIVTASTAGIGFAIAKRLVTDGAKVVICSRKQANVDKALAELTNLGTVSGISCHVGVESDRSKLLDFALKEFGKLNILVSNAGINPHFGDLLDCSEDMWDKIFDVNVKSAFLFSKAAVPHIEKAGGGSILYVSSFTGYVPMKAIPAYSVSKTALLGLTKAMAEACAPRGVRVNCIAPGIIKTSFSQALWQNPDIEKIILQQVPLRRIGSPDECAGISSFMVSDDASYITGETVTVTGGIPARL